MGWMGQSSSVFMRLSIGANRLSMLGLHVVFLCDFVSWVGQAVAMAGMAFSSAWGCNLEGLRK
jgi:hypothetical protein